MEKEERKLLGKAGLNPAKYRVLVSDDLYLHVAGVSGDRVILDKEAGKVVKMIVPRTPGQTVRETGNKIPKSSYHTKERKGNG